MGWLRKILFRLQPLFIRKRIEAELTDEIRTHLEMQAEANMTAGMPAEEARFAAQRQFGGVDQAKEQFRDERGIPWLEDLLQDLRYGVRQLFKAPGFATVAILTVAIGIGACTSMFSIANQVLFRPFEFPHSERLVLLNETAMPRFPFISVSTGTYADWSRQASSFELLAAFTYRSYNTPTFGNAVEIQAKKVTASYFPLLGVPPIAGRFFRPEEETAGKDRVAILTYRLWQERFGGRANAINQTLRLDDQNYTIVGVAPRMPDIEDNATVFVPLPFSAADRANYGAFGLYCFGRLKPGVSLAQAQSEMNLISARIDRGRPTSSRGMGARLTPWRDAIIGSTGPQLTVLLAAVGLLLLIACVNVASLLLARANSRQKEIAVRAALGASRGRIVRQFLCESLLIALAGGVLGFLFACGSMGMLGRFASHFLPRSKSGIAMDGTALWVTSGLMLIAGLGFGLAPALQATRRDMVGSLKESGRGSSGGRKQQRIRSALVVFEVALALVLLAGTGLLARSLSALEGSDEGFKIENVYSNRVALSSGKTYDTPQKITAFTDSGLARISALPEVRFAAFTTGLPMGSSNTLVFTTPGKSMTKASDWPLADGYAITPDYFKVLGIPLLEGRTFGPKDAPGAPRVVIVNQEMAKKYFPGVDPIGQRVMLLTDDNKADVWREIVGVVGNVRPRGPESVIGPQAYEPFAQKPSDFTTLVLQAKGPAPELPREVRDIVHSLDPALPFDTLYPYYLTVGYSWVSQRFSAVLFTIFAAIALLLAAIGIYGVMAYAVSQRTNEIGIRMALGAKAGDVFGLILSGGARIVGLGLSIGMAGALAFTRLLSSLLFNTSPYDPVTLAAVGGLLAVVAFLACWVPARRATKVDPIVALRAE